jgi:hypothetical protein
MKSTVFCDVMHCIVFYCHWGGGLTVTPITQINDRFIVHPQSCQGPSNCPECNGTGRIIQIGDLFLSISSNHTETRYLFSVSQSWASTKYMVGIFFLLPTFPVHGAFQEAQKLSCHHNVHCPINSSVTSLQCLMSKESRLLGSLSISHYGSRGPGRWVLQCKARWSRNFLGLTGARPLLKTFRE